MKKIALLMLSTFCELTFAQKTTISASEDDARIVVNGQLVGSGSYVLKTDKNECYNVKVQKVSFLKYEATVCGKKAGPEPPKTLFFDMKKDDSEEASIKTDQANIDFEIEVNKNLSPTDAWKLTTQIVTDYFDAIEVSDKETSYLRTAWSVQSFSQNTIRTRLIIKLSKSDPLTFKIKLNSEFSGSNASSVKADEQFHEWDRVLRKYKNVISDFSTRLSAK
ncbi:hypothetical protein [Epilithonimonas tenax]|uniref:hypothetical protein n=1 Tax=Epilithonimonas tenax TaxID=191577 RepID=UPI000404E66E|nr:hypothetical protein [Epilithonimonas tenax]